MGSTDKYLEIMGDTLSFQNIYVNFAYNYSTNRVDKSDFIINSVSDSFLSIPPVDYQVTNEFKKIQFCLQRQNMQLMKKLTLKKSYFRLRYGMENAQLTNWK